MHFLLQVFYLLLLQAASYHNHPPDQKKQTLKKNFLKFPIQIWLHLILLSFATTIVVLPCVCFFHKAQKEREKQLKLQKLAGTQKHQKLYYNHFLKFFQISD